MTGEETAGVVFLGVLALSQAWLAAVLVREMRRSARFRRDAVASPSPGEVLEQETKLDEGERSRPPARVPVRFFTAEGEEVVAELPRIDLPSAPDGVIRIKYDPADPTRAGVVRKDGTAHHGSVVFTGVLLFITTAILVSILFAMAAIL